MQGREYVIYFCLYWSFWWDSNPRPDAYEASALPTEPQKHEKYINTKLIDAQEIKW